jgi:hypothetical protein
MTLGLGIIQTQPFQMILMMLAGWLNRHQQDVIKSYISV